MAIFLLIFSLYCCESAGWCQNSPPESFHYGKILFLIQQGEHELALNLYMSNFKSTQRHDFDLLHQIALRILEYGFKLSDPESQLLALFGASVSAHEDAYYILEESLKSKYPEIQIIALNALARFQNDRADQALLKALGSPSLQVRYEAAHQLCKKKHIQAISQTESLMYKSSHSLWSVYPPLFAQIDDPRSTCILRKLFANSSLDVRLSAIASVAKYKRDDLLPQIRQLITHCQFAQQEACAHALGKLKDEPSIPKLEKLLSSQYSTVSLAAAMALYQLGQHDALNVIEKEARNENPFAIVALGSLSDQSSLLLDLLNSSNLQVRLNTVIALLTLHHSEALAGIEEFLIRDKRDLGFITNTSPGKAFKTWKVIPSASQLLINDQSAHDDHIELKEFFLEKARELSTDRFIELAHKIFNMQQNDLVPKTVELLEDLGTEKAIDCLKQHHQQLGAPFVRHYCTLALYNLQEPGPYGEQLRKWIKSECQTEFIRFQPFNHWELGKDSYTLTPEETSKLLIDVFEAFAIHQDSAGIETLVEAIAIGHSKNKYALAGLLLRATQ